MNDIQWERDWTVPSARRTQTSSLTADLGIWGIPMVLKLQFTIMPSVAVKERGSYHTIAASFLPHNCYLRTFPIHKYSCFDKNKTISLNLVDNQNKSY